MFDSFQCRPKSGTREAAEGGHPGGGFGINGSLDHIATEIIIDFDNSQRIYSLENVACI
jgi:hypothetical protein